MSGGTPVTRHPAVFQSACRCFRLFYQSLINLSTLRVSETRSLILVVTEYCCCCCCCNVVVSVVTLFMLLLVLLLLLLLLLLLVLWLLLSPLLLRCRFVVAPRGG